MDGDVRDTRAVTAASDGVDAICPTAALVALWRRDPSEHDAINVGGLQSALSAAREHQLAHRLHLVVRAAGPTAAPVDREPLSTDESRGA